MDEDGERKKQKPLTFAGLTALSQALDSKQAHTSFGKLPLSIEGSAPQYQFSKMKRDDGAKLFMGELTKTDNAGKNSPGPVYIYQDQIKYDNAPGWSLGTEVRIGEDKPKYDFYENALFLDDPIEADLSRKNRCLAPKIGTEPRFNVNNMDGNPGPQYYPKEKPVYPKAEHYTFGYRRGQTLKNQTSTPASVGPGRYVPEASALPSEKQNFPRWTLPKAGRPKDERLRPDRNQTYDTRSAFGEQCHSKNKTGQKTHFGSSGRAQSNRLGTFKDQMQGGLSVKLYHPKW